MRFSAPRNVSWLLATTLGVVGILGNYYEIPVISANAFWFVVAGFALFVFATLLKNL